MQRLACHTTASSVVVSSPDVRSQSNFQDYKARPHRTRIVDDYLRANNVNRMNWPAMSPDLSCIEQVWHVLERAVPARLDRNSTLQDLRRFLRDEWARIPQQTIRKLVFSSKNKSPWMPANNGGYTHYWQFGQFFGQMYTTVTEEIIIQRVIE